MISTSWGSAEDPTDPTTKQIDQILQDAASMGVTLCAASGDSGSRDDPNNPDQAAVDFPASSPSALGCGGSRARRSPTRFSGKTIPAAESVGSSTSPLIRRMPESHRPSIQTAPYAVELPTSRATPIPRPVTRSWWTARTSPSAARARWHPLWAGLIARINQKLGHNAGFINTILYQNLQAFKDITSGSNTDYNARRGWDPCTGLGSPKGAAILQALSGNGSESRSETGPAVAG